MSGWLYEGQDFFSPVYSCESQAVTACQDIADSLDEGFRRATIIINSSKVFDLVLHDKLLTKIAGNGVVLRVVVWVRDLLFERSQSVSVGGQQSEEVRANSGVPQGSLSDPLTFLSYVNDIWRNFE
jgi:hypothetical protein